MSKVISKKKQVVLEPDSPEYRIAVIQLHKLERIAVERLFDKEEAQLYDILCRNLKLSKGDPTVISGEYTKISSNVEDNTLMEIALGSESVNEEIKQRAKKLLETDEK